MKQQHRETENLHNKMPLYSYVLFWLIILLFFTACSHEKPLDDYVYYRLNGDISTLDPAYITDVNNGAIASKINRGLVKLDETMTITPDIAERWEILDDGRLYRFYLKKDVTFSNGRTVRAQDFKYSFERIMKRDTLSPNSWLFERVKAFNVVREDVFEIYLKEAFLPFLSMLTVPSASVVPKEEVDRLGKQFSFRPIGAGDYYLAHWQAGIEIRLNMRDDINRSKKIKGIIYKIIPEDITAIVEFDIARIDILGLPNNAFRRFSRDVFWKDRLITVKSLNTYYLGMNTEKSPFNDKDIRIAVAMAIDRERILNTFWEKRGRLAMGIVPDLLRTWDLKNTIRYAPEESRKILKEKGIKEIKAVMFISSDQDNVDIAEIIQRYLSVVGIKIQIRQLEWSAYKEAINKGEADLFWLSWWADYPNAENFLYPLFHSFNKGYGGNRTRFVNKEVDSLIERARRQSDKKNAEKLYGEIEDILLKEMPLIPFWHRNDYILVQPWIEGYKGFPVYTMDKGIDLMKNIK